MSQIVLIARWPRRVEYLGGDEHDLGRLLRRYCRGAESVDLYCWQSTFFDVTRVTKAQLAWEKAARTPPALPATNEPEPGVMQPVPAQTVRSAESAWFQSSSTKPEKGGDPHGQEIL